MGISQTSSSQQYFPVRSMNEINGGDCKKLRAPAYNIAHFYSEQDIVGREDVPGSPRAVHKGVNISRIKDI